MGASFPEGMIFNVKDKSTAFVGVQSHRLDKCFRKLNRKKKPSLPIHKRKELLNVKVVCFGVETPQSM